MSKTTIGCVEILYPAEKGRFVRGILRGGFVRGVCLVYFDPTPPLQAVLHFPWGEHSKSDDQPAPIVKPRGLPSAPGPSLITLNKVALYVDPRGAKEGNERAITVAEARKLKSRRFLSDNITYYLDPDVKAPTWLTPAEVERAGLRYAEAVEGPVHADLLGVAAMMRHLEQQLLHRNRRPKVRLVVWAT